MDAIVASGTPDAIAPTGGANVIGRKYKDIVQDMVDGYAYGQTDSGTWMGGWGYDWNNGNSDNSVNQWAAIGLLGGESVIGSGPGKSGDRPGVRQDGQQELPDQHAVPLRCLHRRVRVYEQRLLLPLGTVRDHAGGHGADGPGRHRAGQRAVG